MMCKNIKYAYYQLGRGLGLPPSELKSIKRANRPFDEAIDDMLLLWLKQCYDVQRHGHPTWRRLVEAVDSPNGGNDSALAIDHRQQTSYPWYVCKKCLSA